MRFTLRGARLVDATMDIVQGDISIDDVLIESVGGDEVSGEVIDLSGSIVMPGFIEVHTHGGGGFALHTTDTEEIRSYGRWVTSTGVTSYLIAVVGTPGALPDQQIATAIEIVEEYQQQGSGVAEPLGIFLEGPYINEKRRGAHPPIWLRTPDEAETKHVLEQTKGYLRLVTIAPELPGAEEMIRRLVEAGVTVSIGHTDADYEQTRQAIEQGITHATHCFNAMRQLQHREPGPLAAIAQAPQVMGELIADGVHVHPAMMEMLLRLIGTERTVVITDAQAAAGVPDAVFEFAGQKLHVACGAARLEDETLAGSVLTMDAALRNMLGLAGVSLSDAVSMLTLNPARSIKLDQRKGLLKAGYDADLLIFDADLQLKATICRGQLVYVADGYQSPLQQLQTI